MKVEDLKIGDIVFTTLGYSIHIFFITNLDPDPASSNILYEVPEIRVVAEPNNRYWRKVVSYVSSKTNKNDWNIHTIEACKHITQLPKQDKRDALRIILA